MKKIYKYPLERTDRQELTLPEKAEILEVAVQNGELCLWALVDPEAPGAQTMLAIVGTGHDAEHVEGLKHIATVFDGPFVWHVFKDPSYVSEYRLAI